MITTDNFTILPSPSLPTILGLKWGMPQEECLLVPGILQLKVASNYIVAQFPFENRYETHLLFDTNGGLKRINAEIYVSQSFWDENNIENIENLTEKCKSKYKDLVNYYSSILGIPAFSGVWGTAGYPEDQTAWYLTYWNCLEGRIQVELDHPDKEYPIVVRVGWYPISVSL